MARRNTRMERQSAFLWLATLTAVVVAVILLASAALMKRQLPADDPVQGPPPSSSQSSEAELPQTSSGHESEEPASGEASSTPASSSASNSAPAVRPPSDPTKLNIKQPGLYEAPLIYKQAILSSGGVQLKNKVIEGDLFILDSVGDGDILLENVQVGGNIYLYGGNPVQMIGVTAPKMRIQRDNGPVSVEISGETTIDHTLVMCNTTLRQRSLDGDGFVTLQIADGGVLGRINLTLLSVETDMLLGDFDSRVSVATNAKVKEVQANAPMTLAGNGKVKNLVVRHDRVQYEPTPENITVKRGFDEPVQLSGDREKLPDGVRELERPEDVYLYEEDGALVVRYEHVPDNNGYCIALMVDDRQQELLYTEVDEEWFVVSRDLAAFDGHRVQVKVKALGDYYDETADSRYEESNQMDLT